MRAIDDLLELVFV